MHSGHDIVIVESYYDYLGDGDGDMTVRWGGALRVVCEPARARTQHMIVGCVGTLRSGPCPSLVPGETATTPASQPGPGRGMDREIDMVQVDIL